MVEVHRVSTFLFQEDQGNVPAARQRRTRRKRMAEELMAREKAEMEQMQVDEL